MKRPGVALVALVLLAGGAVLVAPRLLAATLGREGVSVASVGWCSEGMCLAGVARGEARAERVTAGRDGVVRVEGATVPVGALLDAVRAAGGSDRAGGDDRGGGGGALGALARRFVRRVEVRGLTVPGTPLPSLSGEVWPARRLAGEGVEVDGDTVRAEVQTPFGTVALGMSRAEAAAGVEGLVVDARCAACVVPAPGPHDAPLTLPEVVARGAWRDGAFEGEVRVGEVRAAVQARPDGDTILAEVALDEAPIASVYAIFAPWVPEVRRARIGGTLGATARVRVADGALAALGALGAGDARGAAAGGGAPASGGARAAAANDVAPDEAAANDVVPDEAAANDVAPDDVAPDGDAGGAALPFSVEVFEPRIDGFVVSGLVPDTLRRGPFQFRGRGADEAPVLFTRGEGTPEWVPLDALGPWLPAAVIAAEDGAFRGHPGYSLAGMQEAAAYNDEKGRIRRGGSTLTQQLAKNLFLDGTRSYARKLRELLYAVELERTLGKARILELYLNLVEFAPGVRGAGPAADLYFLKAPSGLLPEEAAWLADILRYPSTAYREQYLGGRVDPGRVNWILRNLQGVPEEARAAALTRTVHLVPP